MASLHIYNSACTPRIPPELFRSILGHLGGHRPTLATLAQCYSLLHAEAELQLYNTLDEYSASDASLHIRFLTTITRYPRLALLVKVYHNLNIVHHHEAPLWPLLHQALRRMDNLKVLHFRMFGGQPTAELLDGTSFQLERLHWANHSEGPVMATVLKEQTNLKYLYLLLRQGTTLSPECCPNLKVLSGNRVALEALLPGRHVADAAWIPEFLDASLGTGEAADFRHIGPALRNLKSLTFGGYFLRPHFRFIADYLVRLERLELVGFFPDEMILLARLQSLHELVFSYGCGTHRLSIPRESDQRQQLVDDLFSLCPNLMHVDMAFEWTTAAEIRYQRWTRETKDSPVTVPMMEVKCGWFAGRASII